MIGKRYRTPTEYKWVAMWPESRKLGTLLLGIAMVAAAIAGVAVDLLPISVETSVALLGLTLIVWSRRGRRPGISVDSAGRCVLRFQPWFAPQFKGALVLGLAGIATIWSGATGAAPVWFIAAGAAFVGLPLYLTPLLIRNSRGASLTFDSETFRVENRLPRIRCDQEFRWDAVSELSLTSFTSAQTSKPLPIITFGCPTDSVVTHTSPSEGRAVLEVADGQWRLWAAWFTVDPNALLATMRYLSAAPEHRAKMTVADLEAMLTPPRQVER